MDVSTKPPVGIVGGVGPYAGLDLGKKIFDNTLAQRDQDHLDVLLVSCPRLIPDRTTFLLGERSGENPAYGIVTCMELLSQSGVTVVGVPCNTAHSPEIFDLVVSEAAQRVPQMRILHIIRETFGWVERLFPHGCQVGLLATPGTYASGVYRHIFEEGGKFQLVEPDDEGKRRVRDSIYHGSYGIKAHSNPVNFRAVDYLTAETWRLNERGAEVVIMGCTEIPLALDTRKFPFPIVDPAVALARAFIREVAPDKLRPLHETQPSSQLPERAS